MKPQLPLYIEHGGMTVYPQPVIAPGMEYLGFLLEGDEAMLAALCDRVLNAALPKSHPPFRPLSRWVLLSVARLPKLTSGIARYSGQVWLREQEVAFWMIVGKSGGQPMWFNPYIFVDHPWALSAGREIFGYAKEYGWIGMPEDLRDAKSLTLDTVAVPSFGSPDPSLQEARRRRLLDLERVGGTFREIERSLETLLLELGRLIEGPGLLSSLKLFWEMLREVRDNQVATLFLKQFRDISDGMDAAYQQLVWAPARLDKLHGLGLLGVYHLTLQPLDSHPIAQDLGLRLDARSAKVPGFWLKVDFALGEGGPLQSEEKT